MSSDNQKRKVLLTSVLARLTEARELISDPKRWAQNSSARDAEGGYVQPSDLSAVSWCASGAVRHCTNAHRDHYKIFDEAILALEQITFHIMKNFMFVSSYNDSHTHEEVLGVFDMAIANVKRDLAELT